MHHAIPLFARAPHWPLIFWTSYAAWALMEMWIFRRDARRAHGAKADRGGLLILVILILPGLAGVFLAPHIWPWARIALPARAMFVFAIALMWIGMALRLWAVLTLGRFFRTSVFIHDDHRLITSGPYRVLRHPGYTGGMMTMAGLSLAMGNWLSVAIGLGALLLAYAWRIHVEEKALAARFGAEFEAHRRRTWALIPLIW